MMDDGWRTGVAQVRRRNLYTVVVGLSTVVALASACAGGDGSVSVDNGVATVRIAEAGQTMAQAPFLAAMSMGVFAEHDIAVESVGVFVNNSDTINAMSSGSADIANPGAIVVLDAVDAGAPLKAVAASTFGTQVVVLANETVAALEASTGVTPQSTPEDKLAALRGLTIATPGAGSSNDQTIRAWLEDAGLNGDGDLTLVPSAPTAMISGMENGLYDGVTRTIDPIAADAIERGVATVWLEQAELPEWVPQVTTLTVVTDRFIQSNPDVAQRYSDALAQAADMITDPSTTEQVRDAVRTKYFPQTDVAAFDLMWKTITPSVVPGQSLTEDQYADYVTLAQKTTGKDYSDIGYEDFFVVKPASNK